MPRSALPEVLDAAAVALIPDVADRARGQSSMKLYDYCARGVPVVATTGHLEHAGELPPHTYLTSGADEMAAAPVAAADEPAGHAAERTAWAAARTWPRRTDAWLAAALGNPTGVPTSPVTPPARARTTPGPPRSRPARALRRR